MTEKWQTKPYKIAGYAWMVILALIGLYEIYASIDTKLGWPDAKTLSQYVQVRGMDQGLFAVIVASFLGWLFYHFVFEKKNNAQADNKSQ